MIVIYHNPRCSKSRACLKTLEASKIDHEVVKYLDEDLSIEKLEHIINLLKIKPIDLVRKNEKLWKENFKNLDFTDKELIGVMVKYPKLIERPIIINGNKAIIGRPPERVLDLI